MAVQVSETPLNSITTSRCFTAGFSFLRPQVSFVLVSPGFNVLGYNQLQTPLKEIAALLEGLQMIVCTKKINKMTATQW